MPDAVRRRPFHSHWPPSSAEGSHRPQMTQKWAAIMRTLAQSAIYFIILQMGKNLIFIWLWWWSIVHLAVAMSNGTFSCNKLPHPKLSFFTARWHRYRQTKQQRLPCRCLSVPRRLGHLTAIIRTLIGINLYFFVNDLLLIVWAGLKLNKKRLPIWRTSIIVLQSAPWQTERSGWPNANAV